MLLDKAMAADSAALLRHLLASRPLEKRWWRRVESVEVEAMAAVAMVRATAA
jgi:hypothetical protein